MKSRNIAIALTILAVATSAFADDKPAATDQTVAFRTTIGDPRYVSSAAKGGLNTKSKEITGNSTFLLIDLNGGELADGDKVQIKWVPSSAKPTYWHEGEGKVDRKGGKPDASYTFTVKLKATTVKDAPRVLTLQTASGKWVSTPATNSALATSEKQEDAMSLELVENPAPKAAEKDDE